MIVGFFGPSESGKDTAAQYMVERYGFLQIAFADEMKRIAKRIWQFSDDQLWGPQEMKNKPDLRYAIPGKGHLTPRACLQALGTEVGRNIYEDTWANYALDVANKILDGGHGYDQKLGFLRRRSLRRFFFTRPRGVTISDVRFPNEIRRLHEEGGLVVKLRRAGKGGDIKGGIAGHASERIMDEIPDSEFDYVLDVPEGIAAFHAALDKVYTFLPKNRSRRR